MGVQNRATYKAQKEVSFADNTNELIKALTMRISLEDLADSVTWLTENETISGEWTFAGSLIVSGDLVVSGSTLQIDSQIVTADAVIDMNDGEVGAGVTLGYSGLNIERGSADNYWFGFDEVRNAFTMGTITALSAPQIATTEVVATRIDNPTNGYIPYWENSANRLNFDSFNNLLTANDVTGMSNISFASTDTIHLPTNPNSTAFGAMKFTGGNLSIYDGGWQIVGTINASSSVLVSGTPMSGQLAVWTGTNTVEGTDSISVTANASTGDFNSLTLKAISDQPTLSDGFGNQISMYIGDSAGEEEIALIRAERYGGADDRGRIVLGTAYNGFMSDRLSIEATRVLLPFGAAKLQIGGGPGLDSYLDLTESETEWGSVAGGAGVRFFTDNSESIFHIKTSNGTTDYDVLKIDQNSGEIEIKKELFLLKNFNVGDIADSLTDNRIYCSNSGKGIISFADGNIGSQAFSGRVFYDHSIATLGLSVDNVTTSAAQFLLSSSGLKLASLGTGTLYSNAGMITNINPSDKKLKENFQDLNYGLKEVLRLSHHWYNYIGEGTLKLGWLAQEVRTIMPELVSSYKGQSKKYLGLNTEAMPALNQRAIQEFYSEYQKQIQLLKSEIQSLKTQQS